MSDRQVLNTNVETLDTEMIHVLGETKLDGARFPHTTQNGAKLKRMNC